MTLIRTAVLVLLLYRPNTSSFPTNSEQQHTNTGASSATSTLSRPGTANNNSSGEGTPIYLNVYEPAGKNQGSVAGFGIYHTGVEINGVEYCFAGGTGLDFTDVRSGVMEQTPKTTPDRSQWKFKESVELGRVKWTSKQFSDLLKEMQVAFPASTYHIVHRNCNHFTEFVVSFLTS